MNTLRTYILCAALLLTASACTHNDGDIGDLYGRWQLSEMQVADSTATPSDLFISFQGQVVFVSYSHYEEHDALDYSGSFTHTGDSLVIRMVPRDGIGENLGRFMASRWGMPDYRAIRLRVAQLDSGHMFLTCGDDSWSFRKF